MNEIGERNQRTRVTPGYEAFVRTVVAAIEKEDGTRPVIENDWVEPDPDRVFCSPILTGHWYGRLHAEYLSKLDRKAEALRDVGRPLFITELGDWGLPEMPLLADAPFWDARASYAAGLAATLWPSSMARFVHETQRYQGLSDRLQIEILRQHDHIGGYCLTELTDVPHEFNGLLDLHREPKPLAVQEVTRVNQPVLPMLRLQSLVVVSGDLIPAALHVANDGPALSDVTVELRVGRSMTAVRIGDLPADTVTAAGVVSVGTPAVPGAHDLLLTLRAQGRVVAENFYPVHIVAEPIAGYAVQVVGAGPTAEALHSALAAVGAEAAGSGPTFVAEGALEAELGMELAAQLGAGATVVVLAQAVESGEHYPVPVELAAVETAWGSSVFHFTTDCGGLPSLPRRNLLVAEESTVQARNVVIRVAEEPFPDEPVVISYKPVPGSITGTVVGLHRVGSGRLILCQYRLTAGAAGGDAAARALLADLVRWAADPRPPTAADRVTKDDGRALTYYSFPATS